MDLTDFELELEPVEPPPRSVQLKLRPVGLCLGCSPQEHDISRLQEIIESTLAPSVRIIDSSGRLAWRDLDVDAFIEESIRAA
jgi:hypothetical protein